jgi:hypothetical protein
LAAALPTLPKPWTATVLCAGCNPSFSAAAISTVATPRPVASLRPWLPPISMGLPVTTPGTAYPTVMEYVSIIHAITCGLVFTSGAGMSFAGPMMMEISLV